MSCWQVFHTRKWDELCCHRDEDDWNNAYSSFCHYITWQWNRLRDGEIWFLYQNDGLFKELSVRVCFINGISRQRFRGAAQIPFLCVVSELWCKLLFGWMQRLKSSLGFKWHLNFFFFFTAESSLCCPIYDCCCQEKRFYLKQKGLKVINLSTWGLSSGIEV